MVTIDFMKSNKERRRKGPQIGNHMPLGCALKKKKPTNRQPHASRLSFYVEKLKINISR
jgi:hypothetical protein